MGRFFDVTRRVMAGMTCGFLRIPVSFELVTPWSLLGGGGGLRFLGKEPDVIPFQSSPGSAT